MKYSIQRHDGKSMTHCLQELERARKENTLTRLIDAEALFSWYEGSRTKYPVTEDYSAYSTMMMYEIFDEIDDAPTVDAEVVVRCSDCKHSGIYAHERVIPGSERSGSERYCLETGLPKVVEDNYYCGKGKRREV